MRNLVITFFCLILSQVDALSQKSFNQNINIQGYKFIKCYPSDSSSIFNYENPDNSSVAIKVFYPSSGEPYTLYKRSDGKYMGFEYIYLDQNKRLVSFEEHNSYKGMAKLVEWKRISDALDTIIVRLPSAQSRQNYGEAFYSQKGQKFSNISLASLEGESIDTDRLKGKVLVFNFWFVGCPPCRKEIPELNKLVKEFDDKKVVFVAPALDKKERLKGFLNESPFNYKIVANSRTLAEELNIISYPSHIVVDQQGTIYYLGNGYSKDSTNELRNAITRLLED